MKIEFENPKHEALVNNFSKLQKKFDRKGVKNADEIIATLDVLKAADTLADVPRAYRPHPLASTYKGCFAVNVTKTHRNIFKANHEGDPHFRIDHYQSITSITVLEIFKDYH